jgi:hypothetical protein
MRGVQNLWPPCQNYILQILWNLAFQHLNNTVNPDLTWLKGDLRMESYSIAVDKCREEGFQGLCLVVNT